MEESEKGSETQEKTLSHTMILSLLACSVPVSSMPHIFKCEVRRKTR